MRRSKCSGIANYCLRGSIVGNGAGDDLRRRFRFVAKRNFVFTQQSAAATRCFKNKLEGNGEDKYEANKIQVAVA